MTRHDPCRWFAALCATSVVLFVLLCVQYVSTDPYEVDQLWPLAILTGLSVFATAAWAMWVVVVMILFDGNFPSLPTRAKYDARLRPPTDPPAAAWRLVEADGAGDPWSVA